MPARLRTSLAARTFPTALLFACNASGADDPGWTGTSGPIDTLESTSSAGDEPTPTASTTADAGAEGGSSGGTAPSDDDDDDDDDAGPSSDADSGEASDTGELPIPLFASGFEESTELGCTPDAITDAGLWDDYGGSGACNGPVHDADIVTRIAQAGARALQITQKPGNINGTDFRLVKIFGDQAELTMVGYVRFADDWQWSTADHKLFIFTDPDETAQNIYVNTRGQAGDPQHTRLVLSSIPAGDSVFSDDDPAHLLTVGIWYRIRVHVVAGDHGALEAWLTPEGEAEMKLDLVHEAGPDANIADLPIGSIGGFKIDTTYNDGANISAPMFQWYDSIAVYEGSLP